MTSVGTGIAQGVADFQLRPGLDCTRLPNSYSFVLAPWVSCPSRNPHCSCSQHCPSIRSVHTSRTPLLLSPIYHNSFPRRYSSSYASPSPILMAVRLRLILRQQLQPPISCRRPTNQITKSPSQFLLPLQPPRMPIDLDLNLLDLHLIQIQSHLLAILYRTRKNTTC